MRNGHAGRYTDEVASRLIALRNKGMVFSRLAPPRFQAALYLAAFKTILQENTARIRSVHPRGYDEVDARNDDGKFAIRAALRCSHYRQRLMVMEPRTVYQYCQNTPNSRTIHSQSNWPRQWIRG